MTDHTAEWLEDNQDGPPHGLKVTAPQLEYLMDYLEDDYRRLDLMTDEISMAFLMVREEIEELELRASKGHEVEKQLQGKTIVNPLMLEERYIEHNRVVDQMLRYRDLLVANGIDPGDTK